LVASLLNKNATRITSVRTTAYTHGESDHIIYGARTAVGTQLKYGNVRSAAADWSVYPVGTIFQIEGLPYVYQVDDYGSALVGTNTIDLYKPDKATMKAWGVRNVNIRVLKWGSFSKSLSIMKDRTAIRTFAAWWRALKAVRRTAHHCDQAGTCGLCAEQRLRTAVPAAARFPWTTRTPLPCW
jgi:3D (Asp-Asp-Asp) domain-containing protein